MNPRCRYSLVWDSRQKDFIKYLAAFAVGVGFGVAMTLLAK